MTLDEVLLNVKAVGLDSIVRQTEIQTEEDKEHYQGLNYDIRLTEAEFREKFEVDPKHICYTNSISFGSFYFNEETLAVCPFHLDYFLAHEQGMSSILTPEGAYKSIAKREEEVANNKYIGSLMTLPDGMRLEFFKLLVEKKGKSVPDLYDLFIEFYSDSDYGFTRVDRSTVAAIVNSKSPNEKRSTTMKLKKYPDVITVYRGGNSASTPYEDAYSWTTDINVANFFAIRRGYGPAYIAKGEINKSDVIELIDSRNEAEILVDPSKVRMVEVADLLGYDDLREIFENIIPMYHKYRDMIKGLHFNMDSHIHGKEHSARVLLMCLILSELLNLPSSDRKILAMASVYHDSYRTHDGFKTQIIRQTMILTQKLNQRVRV